jgi:hypothetical protein
MSTLERRMEDENQYRIKNEEEIRKYLETRVVGIMEKLKNDEKMSLKREKRLMA